MSTTATEIDEGLDPENPLVEGDTEYSVRLIFRVQANDPEHARTRFIQAINEHGFNTWVYRVTDTDSDEEFMVQDGAIYSPEGYAEEVERLEREAAEDDEDDDDEPDPTP